MEKRIYGIINHQNIFTDISTSMKGTKRYATLNGYFKVGYRIGYNVTATHEKLNDKWVEYVE
jgi:hypothetical protein